MKPPVRYPAYSAVIAAGQTGRAGLPSLVFCCAATLLLGYMLFLMFIETVLATGMLADPSALFNGTTPASMFILLATFAVWPVALALVLPIIHQRGFASVLGAPWLAQFGKVAAIMIVLHLVLTILPPWDAAGTEQNTAFGLWLTLLPLSLLAVLMQVGSEEVIFRGYLQQALAASGLPAVVWIVLPSVLFGLGHYDAAAGSNAWLIVLWAVIFGLLMADLTARAGSVGPAIAVHLANNVLALLLVGLDDGLNGLALYVYPLGIEDEAAVRALLPVDFALMVVSWLAARLALRR